MLRLRRSIRGGRGGDVLGRRNNFLTETGHKLFEWFHDLILKPFAVGILLFLQILFNRLGIPIVDKRCHLLQQAAENVSDYMGDKGLTRWFMTAYWSVFCYVFGCDNGYIARHFLIMEEYAELKRRAEKKGEEFPNGKTKDYVERELLKKGLDKLR